MFRLLKSSRWIGQAQVGRFKLYYKIGETSNIHSRTQVFWTLILAPINTYLIRTFQKISYPLTYRLF